MFKNYIRIAWRNLLKNRTSSTINILGLAVGMAVAVLTGLWLHDELSFNMYHDNYSRIARVAEVGVSPEHGKFMTSTLSYPLSSLLVKDYAGNFERMVRVSWTSTSILSAGDKNISVPGQYMDAAAPDMLTLKMVYGTRAGLSDLKSILISASTAKALFGSVDPVGQTLLINNTTDVRVTGVYEDLPLNTELAQLKFISPFELWWKNNTWLEHAKDQYWNHFMKLYVEIKPGSSFATVDGQIGNVLMNAVRNFTDDNHKGLMANHPILQLDKMSDWHMEGADRQAHKEGATARLIWMVSLIGAFVLVLACINFMNLSTARSEKRAREVGIRKTMGSLRRQLIGQFYGESLMIVVFAFLLALVLTLVSLGWFNDLTGKQMHIPFTAPGFWAVSIVFIVLTAFIAGSYPALYLSSFNPIKALKGHARLGRNSVMPRKVLVVFQFALSVALINCTLVVLRQVQYAKDRPIGYDQDGLLMINMRSSDFYGKYNLLRDELLKTGVVSEFSESMGKVTELASNNGGFDWAGRDPRKEQNYGTLAVSPEYGKTIGWKVVQGRDFSRAFQTDSLGLIVNESALHDMGITDPIGKDVTWVWWQDPSQVLHYKIIGVVKDIVAESPYEPTKPTVYYQKGHNGSVSVMNIKVRPTVAMSRALPAIEGVMKRIIPTAPFDYQFADVDYGLKFAAEVRLSRLAGFFAALAIFISCLGLFGLASFTAEQRTKEVGIRKVLGASVYNVWGLLSREFVLLVSISLLVAIPVAYYFMFQWLEGYQYRTNISWLIFVVTSVGAMVITLTTVSFQAIKAAVVNPVDSLRSE